VLYVVFLLLQLGFVLFWKAKTGEKAACKMLVKLTPGVKCFCVEKNPNIPRIKNGTKADRDRAM